MRRPLFIFLAAAILCLPAWAQLYEAGTTYSNTQHSGSSGRMIGVDSAGFVHVVWTNQLGPTGTARHAYYNVWDPQQFGFLYPGGYQADMSARAEYACLALHPSGFCYPAFQQLRPGDPQLCSCVGMDYLPTFGAFTTSHPDPLYENGHAVEMLWPRIAQDSGGNLHLLALENSIASEFDERRLFYARGTPTFDEDGCGLQVEWQDVGGADWLPMGESQLPAHDIAAGRNSNRVAIAWLRPGSGPLDPTNRYNNDVFVRWSGDGGQAWSAPLNVTQFVPPDADCHAATGNDVCCSRDTLRACNDLSLLVDDAGIVHVAFTTVARYQWLNQLTGPFVRPNKAALWYWREGLDSPRLIADDAVADSLLPAPYGLRPGHTILERPSLAEDPATGRLYCAFLRYDPDALSLAGNMNADVYVTVSTDGGMSWAAATNVTQTTPIPAAPPGQNLNEQDPTLAPRVVAGNLHLSYLLDRNGTGSAAGPESNSFYYRRVPVASIAAAPLVPPRPLHVEAVECDTILAAGTPAALPAAATLHPVYPNPFNSEAVLSFDLPRAGSVDLAVYDVLGRRSAVLLDGQRAAGTHTVHWNAAGLPAGLYWIVLNTGGERFVQKVILLR